MFFHWSLSDKSSELFLVFWPISTMFCLVSTHSPISNIFQSPYRDFRDRSKRTSYNWHLPPCFIVFSVFWQGLSIYLSLSYRERKEEAEKFKWSPIYCWCLFIYLFIYYLFIYLLINMVQVQHRWKKCSNRTGWLLKNKPHLGSLAWSTYQLFGRPSYE